MCRAWAVLGLGNPGGPYDGTRHNIGFRALDRLAEDYEVEFQEVEPEGVARIARVDRSDATLWLIKPQTYMNRSGIAAAALAAWLELPPERWIVVCDDADLELGRVRIRGSGGAGGHNGLKSLIECFGTNEFPRVKLGVRGAGRDLAPLADYVLERFESDEERLASALADLGAEAARGVIELGVSAAMNRYNARRAGEAPLPDPDSQAEAEPE